jgi:hypothetical protein
MRNMAIFITGRYKMKHIGDSLNKAMENAKFKKEKQKAEKRKPEDSKAGRYLNRMKEKYADQIENLHNPPRKLWRNMSIKQKARTIYILDDVTSYEFFKDSKPEIDLAYMIITIKNHGFSKIKNNIDKAYEWLVANPNKRKKNYRRFLTNWLKSENGNVQIVINKDSDEEY